MELFRKEAIDALRSPSLGTINLATPASHTYAAWFSGATFVLVLAWAIFGTYTRRENVSGSLVPVAGIVNLNADMAGFVSHVTAHVGQVVKRGQPLMMISGEKVSEAYGATRASVGRDLKEEMSRVEQDMASATSSAEEQLRSSLQQMQELKIQVSQLGVELDVVQRHKTELSHLIERMEPLLTKGYISELQLASERGEESAAETQAIDLDKQRHGLLQQLSLLSSQVSQIPIERDQKINDLSRQLLQLRQSLVTEEANRSTVVTSPVSGTLSSVTARDGQDVSANTLLASIVPQGSALQAQLLVPSSSIGFIHKGTRVALHFKAFPYQKFGIQQGAVVEVSKNALSPSELTSMLGQGMPSDAMYLVYVSLPSQTIDAYGKSESLSPGMDVDADVLLDQRRMGEWLFEPLYGMKKSSSEDSNGAH